MVGPFMQGMLLMGVIYWYSKGMLNMINEYYRTEFQKQLETNTVDKKPAEIDEMEILLKKPDNVIQERKSLFESDVLESLMCPVKHESDVCFNQTELKRFLELTLSVCFSINSNNMLLDKGCHNSFKDPTEIESALKT